MFRRIYDIEQVERGYVVVVDSANSCVRRVNRTTGSAEMYAGQCEKPGDFTGTAKAAEVKFDEPVCSVYVASRNILYYLIKYTSARIVMHNVSSGLCCAQLFQEGSQPVLEKNPN